MHTSHAGICPAHKEPCPCAVPVGSYDDVEYILSMEAPLIDCLVTDCALKPGHAAKFRAFLVSERQMRGAARAGGL